MLSAPRCRIGVVMNASPTNNVGPPPAIEFSELGVMLELLWRGERTALAKCTFCRTLNHRWASHCAACSSKLPAIYRDPLGVARNPPSAPTIATPTRHPVGAGGHVRRELANMLLWMLAMPRDVCWLRWLVCVTPHKSAVAGVCGCGWGRVAGWASGADTSDEPCQDAQAGKAGGCWRYGQHQ